MSGRDWALGLVAVICADAAPVIANTVATEMNALPFLTALPETFSVATDSCGIPTIGFSHLGR
jgi:hypothetical protein